MGLTIVGSTIWPDLTRTQSLNHTIKSILQYIIVQLNVTTITFNLLSQQQDQKFGFQSEYPGLVGDHDTKKKSLSLPGMHKSASEGVIHG